MTEIDWAALQKEAKNASLIPDGEYQAVCVESTATKSSNGKPMLKIKCQITEGPQAPKKVTSQLTVSAESAIALRIFFTQLEAFGVTADFFSANPQLEAVAAAMVNRPITIDVETRAWQGVDRNGLKGIRPPRAGAPTAPGVAVGPPVPVSPGAAPVIPAAAPPVPPTPASAPPVPAF